MIPFYNDIILQNNFQTAYKVEAAFFIDNASS